MVFQRLLPLFSNPYSTRHNPYYVIQTDPICDANRPKRRARYSKPLLEDYRRVRIRYPRIVGLFAGLEN